MDEPVVTRASKRRALLSLVGAFLAALFFTPDALVWPLRYLATFVHECGHLAAGWLSGGSPVGFQVTPDGSGLAWSTGWPLFICAGGYLGLTLVGGTLLYLNAFQGLRKALLLAIGGGCLAMGLAYAQTDWTWWLALGLGGALTTSGLFLPFWVQFHLVNYLGFYIGLQALGDLWRLLGQEFSWAAMMAPYFHGPQHNDASILASHTGIPGLAWAGLWAALALGFLGWSARRAIESEVAERDPGLF